MRARTLGRETIALASAYLFVGLAMGYLAISMHSATYRDEWGFAEFRWAEAFNSGRAPPPFHVDPSSSFNKVVDVSTELGSELAAAAVAHLTAASIEDVYVYGFWGALAAPALFYALLRRCATPAWSAMGAAAATTLTVGFPFYLVDPRGLILTCHALFLLAAWRAMRLRTPGAAALAAFAAALTGFVYFPFGIVEAAMLSILLVLVRARASAVQASILVPAAIIGIFPQAAAPYFSAFFTHVHFPTLVQGDVPHGYPRGLSTRIVAVLLFGIFLALALALRDATRPSYRFLLAATIAGCAFTLIPFSIHRFFTFVAAPLALALAEASSGAVGERARSPALWIWRALRRGPVAGIAALTIIADPRATRRARARPWRAMSVAFLALAALSFVTTPTAAIAHYGTFSADYMEGVRWVAENVQGNFTSDIKFAGAVYAYSDRTSGHFVTDDYGKTDELDALWYSPGVDGTISVMRHEHQSRYLVVTTEMRDVFMAANFYRAGIGPKMDAIAASPQFHLVYANPDVRVYELVGGA